MIKRAKSREEIAEIFTQRTTKCFTTYKQNENGEWVEDKTYGEISSVITEYFEVIFNCGLKIAVTVK